MVKACKVTFNVGFNKYKLMVKSCFPDINAKSLCANPWDESLLGMVGDAARMIMETTKKYADVAPPSNIIQATGDEDDDGIGVLLHIIGSPSQADDGPSSRVPKLK